MSNASLKMSKGDITITEVSAQSTPRTSFSQEQRAHIADLEVVNVQDEDPELILPETSSLVMVIMTNVLLQVTFRLPAIKSDD